MFDNYLENQDYFYGLDAETICLIHARKQYKIVSVELEKQETSTDKKPASTEKSEKKPASTEKKPASAEKKPASAEKKPASTEKKPASTEKKKLIRKIVPSEKVINDDSNNPFKVDQVVKIMSLKSNLNLSETLLNKIGTIRRVNGNDIFVDVDGNEVCLSTTDIISIPSPSSVSSSQETDSSESRVLSPHSLHQATLNIPIGSKVQILSSTIPSLMDHTGVVLSTPATTGGWFRVRTDGDGGGVGGGAIVVCRERALVKLPVEEDIVVIPKKKRGRPSLKAKTEELANEETPKRTRGRSKNKANNLDETMTSGEVSLSEEDVNPKESFAEILQQVDMTTLDMETINDDDVEIMSSLITDKMALDWKQEDIEICNLKYENSNESYGFMVFNNVLEKIIILNRKNNE